MRRDSNLPNYKITKLRNSSRGYILITMMLFLTLITMAGLAVLPDIAQQIQRDREEEMVHRGTEYMRAIKKYYNKLGRYPTRIEELENTNQQRFLRKRYKDPVATGKGDHEFKLVRMGDPALNNLGMGSAALGQASGKGVAAGLGQALMQGGNAGFVAGPNGGVRPATPADADTPQVTGLPGQQASGTSNAGNNDSGNPDAQVDAASGASSKDSGSATTQVFGGGPILGVASTSKATTIREYNKKSHYNEWLFIYDPSGDHGGLLRGPVQPDASRGINGATQPGAPLTPPGQTLAKPGQVSPPQQTQEPPEQ